VAGAGAWMAAAGCTNFDLTPQVSFDADLEQYVAEQIVPGSPLPGPLAESFPIHMDLDLNQKFAAMTTGPIDIIELTSLDLVITGTDRPAGDIDDWSFVDSIDLYVTSTKTGSSLPRMRFATASAPGKTTTMRFTPVAGANLEPYIGEGAQVESQGSVRAPSDDTSFDGLGVYSARSK